MNFRQRLFRFLIGVTLGLLISVTLFREKLHLFTSWLPANKVKSRIQDSYWSVSPEMTCKLECIGWNVERLKHEIPIGTVRFNESKTKQEPKEYQLQFESSTRLESIRFAVRDSSATLMEMATLEPCDCS
jgi:hypothetical protein